MMIGLVQPGTSRGTFLPMMGSRNPTPRRMLRMVPFGDFHISFRPNSFTRASSGVMVAHLTPTPTFLMALAASTVTWSLVLSRYSIPRSKYIRLISRNGVISLSLMYCQMIRVISSPSSSTTGLVTLIFAMGKWAFLELARFARDGLMRYSTASASAKAKALCSFRPYFSSKRRLRRRACHDIPGNEQSADQSSRQARSRPPPGEGSNDGRDREQRHELDRDDGGERHESGIGQRIIQFPGQPQRAALQD